MSQNTITPARRLEQELLSASMPSHPQQPERKAEAFRFCEGYKAFLNECKTEREAVVRGRDLLLAAGYQKYHVGTVYNAGDKIYLPYRQKSLICATIGKRSFEEGFSITVAHVDAPRLDLKPNPLYEKDHFALFKTHYYGGVRKYQWTALPLALHGILYRKDGTPCTLCIGEKENDPVFCITDLLPHLAQEQNKRTLVDGITGEEQNVVTGSLGIPDETVHEKIKLYTMMLLHEKYQITEQDFNRAELEIVPALKARDIGFDRTLIGSYGQDDRVCAYPALLAEMETTAPERTTVCILTDKEEIDSEGVTGMQSMYAFHFLEELCHSTNSDSIVAFHNSKCLCADVSSAYDPTWNDAFDAQNVCHLGKGVSILKYTGEGGKYDASDASAETLRDIISLLDSHQIPWQIGDMGCVDLGGSGTVAMYMARHGIETLDIGVSLLAMHSPCEISNKLDIYSLYQTFLAFYGKKE